MADQPKTSPDYLAAKKEWLERYGDYISQAKNWRMAAISAIGIAALFGAGMVYEADRVHVVPYVVEVDKLGKSVELAKAIKAGAFAQPVVQHVISRFVWLLFTQTPDGNLQKHFIDDSYHYVSKSAEDALDSFYSRHNPYNAYTNDTGGQTVVINSAEPVGEIKKTGGNWIINFTVKKYGKGGEILDEKHYQGTITYGIVPLSNNPDVLEGNPFGIYITHFAFSPEV
ncbi:MAG: type IV secretion system protein [Acidithiobacillus sp.]|nr:type IV secretion system protein [Acidithiobacillus sp.]